MPALGLSAVPSPTKNRISAAIGSADAADADSIAVEALSRPALSGAALSGCTLGNWGRWRRWLSRAGSRRRHDRRDGGARFAPARPRRHQCLRRQDQGCVAGQRILAGPRSREGSEPRPHLGFRRGHHRRFGVATSTATPSVRTTAESDPSPRRPAGESAEESPASALSSNRASSAEADWRGATTANSVGDDTAGFVPTSSPTPGRWPNRRRGCADSDAVGTRDAADGNVGDRSAGSNHPCPAIRTRHSGPGTGPDRRPPNRSDRRRRAPVARWARTASRRAAWQRPPRESLEPELSRRSCPVHRARSAAATAGSSAITTPMPSAMASAPTRPTKCVGRGAEVNASAPTVSWVTRSVPVAGDGETPSAWHRRLSDLDETLSGHITDLRWPPDRHALCQHDLAAHGKDQRVRTRGIWCSPRQTMGRNNPRNPLRPPTQQTLAVSYIHRPRAPEPIRTQQLNLEATRPIVGVSALAGPRKWFDATQCSVCRSRWGENPEA